MLTLLNNRFSNTQGMEDVLPHVNSLDIYIDLALLTMSKRLQILKRS